MRHMPPDDDRTYSEDRAEELRSEYLDLQAKVFELQERMDAIRAEVRGLLPRGSHEIGDGRRVTISPNHRFNEERAADIIPQQYLPLVIKRVPAHDKIDKYACKRVLPGVVYDLCMVKQGEDRVTFT